VNVFDEDMSKATPKSVRAFDAILEGVKAR